MDQIGKLYQNRVMVLQEEINRLEKLLEAQAGPELTKKEQQRRVSAQRDENPNSPRTTVVAPASTSVKADGGLKLSPDYNKRSPLQADLARETQGDPNPLATRLTNIPNFPGDTIKSLYNTSPWMTALGLGGGALYTGLPRTFVNPIANLGKAFAWKIGMVPTKPGPIIPAKAGTFGYNVKTPRPITVAPTFTKPSSLAGNFDTPRVTDLFDPNPTKTTGGVLKAFGSDVFAALKPGGMYSALERWKARSQNDEIIKRWTEVTKPTGESNVRAANVVKSVNNLAKAQTILDNSTSELARMQRINTPTVSQSIRELEQLTDIIPGDTLVRDAQAKNLQGSQVSAKKAAAAATASSKAYSAATQSKVPLLDFDWKAFAKDRFNPKSIAGLRNLATGGLGLVGDLVVGHTVKSGLKQIPYVKDQDLLVDVASATAGGAAGGAIASGLGLGGLALGAAMIPPALVAGTGALSYGVGEKISKITGLEDKITGLSDIRKTPGITRGELDYKHPYIDASGKAEYTQAAADYIRNQATKSGKDVQARSQDRRMTGTSKQ